MRGHGFGIIPDPCKSGARIILRLPAHEFSRQRLLAVPNGNDRELFVSPRPQGLVHRWRSDRGRGSDGGHTP